jgi:hypothetical protein
VGTPKAVLALAKILTEKLGLPLGKARLGIVFQQNGKVAISI